MMSRFTEVRHPGCVEEWVFSTWRPDGTVGLISGHRILGRTAWYWASVARAGRPLLHVVDGDVPVRADPFVVKGEALWAEHHCDADLEQWSVGNETYASAIVDPDDALGRAYGVPTPIAFDLEWYATAAATALVIDDDSDDDANNDNNSEAGYEQSGVVHGAVEILGEPPLEFVETPAHRWHRWTNAAALAPAPWREVTAHTGIRSPFAFPDGTIDDLVLTPAGWARRATGRFSSPG
jgi:hypothetical protein